MTAAAVLLALGVASAHGASITAKTCASAPQRELPDLVRRALKSGKEEIISDDKMPSAVADGMRAAKMLVFHPKGEDMHAFQLLVVPSADGSGLKPVAAIIGRMIETKTAKERRMFRMSLQGRLLQAALITDRMDGAGNSEQEHVEPLALFDPRATMSFRRELGDLCRLAVGGQSEEEMIEDLRRKLPANAQETP